MATLTTLVTGDTGTPATTATTNPVVSPAAADTELVLLVLGNGTPATPSGWTSIGGNAYRTASHNGAISISVPDSTGPIGWVVWRISGVTPGPTSVAGTITGADISIANPDGKTLLPIVAHAGASFTPTEAGDGLAMSWWNLTTSAFTATASGTTYAAFGLAWAAAAVIAGGARHRSYRLTGHR